MSYENTLLFWLRLEQALFIARGRKTLEVLAAQAEFAPLWDALSETDKQKIRMHPADPEQVTLGLAPPAASDPSSCASAPPPPDGA